MRNGWIKIHRKVVECEFFNKPNLSHFWSWCLIKASHKKYTQKVGHQEVSLFSGQFIFGRNKACQETGLSERTIRTCISYFKATNRLTIKTTNKFSIITICKWVTYQSQFDVNDQQNDHQSDHKQEDKEVKNKEEESEDTLLITKNTKKEESPVETQNSVKQQNPVETLKAKFIRIFSDHYKQMSGFPYDDKRSDYIIMDKLIKKHGYDVCITKAELLYELCGEGKEWFAKNGCADFTIGNLSTNWNKILPKPVKMI